MKKTERKKLEKQIIEVVNVLLEKYETSPAKKVQKIVNEAARSVSKKLYKVIKNKPSSTKVNSGAVVISKTQTKGKKK